MKPQMIQSWQGPTPWDYGIRAEKDYEAWLELYGLGEPTTTFASDLAIAEIFDEKSVRDTVSTALRCYGEDVEYMADLVLSLRFLYEAHNGFGQPQTAELYKELHRKARDRYAERFRDEVMG